MTKKIYTQPEFSVVRIGKDITTDVISASVRGGTTDTYYAPGRFDISEDWDTGY